MPSFDDTLEKLGNLARREARLERARQQNLADATMSKAFRDDEDAILQQQVDRIRLEKRNLLDSFVRYPPFHDRHFSKLDQFHTTPADASFEKSVFIMTKFPESTTPVDLALQKVIASTRAAVHACGYVARLASDAHFHPLLWDNVELYLLGSKRGIAILESKYKPELNPNVAMEWGWMRGMGRDILPLVEEDFAYQRADWGGLIEHRFDWDAPDAAIGGAIQAWLKGPSA